MPAIRGHTWRLKVLFVRLSARRNHPVAGLKRRRGRKVVSSGGANGSRGRPLPACSPVGTAGAAASLRAGTPVTEVGTETARARVSERGGGRRTIRTALNIHESLPPGAASKGAVPVARLSPAKQARWNGADYGTDRDQDELNSFHLD